MHRDLEARRKGVPVALALALVCCFHAPIAPQEAGRPAAMLVRELLESLDARAAEARLGFDDPDRCRWRRDPSRRPGLALMDMTAEQREDVRALLATVLSARGSATIAGIMAEQNLLGRHEDGLGDGYYWLAVYGEVGRGRWAWRLGGHHVSVHATYEDDELVAITPLLLGGEMEDAGEHWEGYHLLLRREQLARQLVMACDEQQWRRVLLREGALGSLELSEPEMQPLSDAHEGLSLSDMPPALASVLRELIAEHVEPLRTPLGVPAQADLEREGRRVTFAWAGSREEGRAHSYRIRAPGLLIEYVNSGAHIHSLLRTGRDWGAGR